MEMWLVSFGIIWITEFVLFGMQRATLLISREAGIEWRGGGELLLPRWYPVTWVIRVCKWGLLLAMVVYWDWRYTLGLAIGGYFLSIVLPIPYRAYKGVFRKRVNQLMQQDSNVAIQLQKMLDEAPF
jgi:hypothetical protein